MDIMKHSFQNYILSTKTVDSNSEKWAQIKYNVYRFIDFSELKCYKPMELLDFSVLKSSNLIGFSVLSLYHDKVQCSGGLYHFSKVKYSNSVDFNLITLYYTKVWQFSRTSTLYYGKVQRTLTLYCDKVDHNCRTLTLYYAKVRQSSRIFTLYHFTALKYTVLVDFTLLKCYSGNVVTLYHSNMVTLYHGNVITCCCSSRLSAAAGQCSPWAHLRACELGAGNWTASWELELQAGAVS